MHPEKVDVKKLKLDQSFEDATLPIRSAKEIENRAHALSKGNFTHRPNSVERRLQDINAALALRELMFQLELIRIELAAEHEKLLGSSLQNMGDHHLEQSDECAAEKRSKKVAFVIVLGGVLELAGSFLGAAKATSTIIPILDKLMPALLKGGEIITTSGRVTSSLGNITDKWSQSELQKLEHLYRRTGERISELRNNRDRDNQDKNRALQKLAEMEATYQRLVQELLTRQG